MADFFFSVQNLAEVVPLVTPCGTNPNRYWAHTRPAGLVLKRHFDTGVATIASGKFPQPQRAGWQTIFPISAGCSFLQSYERGISKPARKLAGDLSIVHDNIP